MKVKVAVLITDPDKLSEVMMMFMQMKYITSAVVFTDDSDVVDIINDEYSNIVTVIAPISSHTEQLVNLYNFYLSDRHYEYYMLFDTRSLDIIPSIIEFNAALDKIDFNKIEIIKTFALPSDDGKQVVINDYDNLVFLSTDTITGVRHIPVFLMSNYFMYSHGEKLWDTRHGIGPTKNQLVFNYEYFKFIDCSVRVQVFNV